jgi:uncharacterized membrane protein
MLSLATTSPNRFVILRSSSIVGLIFFLFATTKLKSYNSISGEKKINTTAIVITVSIGFATLIFSIFGASWLNLRQLSLLMEQNEKRESERYTSLVQRISDLEKRIDERFASLETRVDRIERQLEQIFKPILPR